VKIGDSADGSCVMNRSRMTSTSAAARRVSGFSLDLGDLIRSVRELFDPYRPELHYMRGPGPKWRAKHQPRDVGSAGVPALARVKAR
jgi:hypothetical protein